MLSPRSPHTTLGAGRNISWLLDVRVADRPNQVFFVWEPFTGASQAWTYAGFAEAVARVAGGFSRRGVVSGDRVLIHLDNRPEFLVAWFACARLGAVAVSTNTRSSLDEVMYYASHCGACAAVTQPSYAALVEAALPQAKAVWIARGDADDAPIETGRAFDELLTSEPAPAAPVSAYAPVGIQYTSGTTGRPKAVVLTHANALWGGKVNAAHEGLTDRDIQYVYSPLFHINALAYSMLATMWAGGGFVLTPRWSTSRFWDISLRNRCTFASQLYFTLRALGAVETPKRHFYRLFGTGMSGHPSENTLGVPTMGWWGMTETISHPIIGDIQVPNTPRTIGRAAPEYEVAAVRDDGSPVEPGETGDLLVKGVPGVSLFAGYLNDDAATAAAFDEFGWFRTGDRVTVQADGGIVFADRSKDMLKIGAENVAASEIERVIAAVPGVGEVAVAAAPHPMLDEVPVAFVIAPEPSDALAAAILSACREKLADFKVPQQVRFVPDLPRSTLEKVAKHKLREILKEEAAQKAPA